METKIQTYDPNSTRGRKKSEAEPTSRRQGQVREAQRALRERKVQYIRNLEAQVAELSAKLNVAQPQETRTLVSDLETQIVNLQTECAFLRQQQQQQQQLVTAFDPSKFNQIKAECISCVAERMKSEIYLSQIRFLDGKVCELNAELSLLRQSTVASKATNLGLFQSDSQIFDFQNGVGFADNSALLPQNMPSQAEFSQWMQPLDEALQFDPTVFNFAPSQSAVNTTVPASADSEWLDMMADTSTTVNSSRILKYSATELYGTPETQFVKLLVKEVLYFQNEENIALLNRTLSLFLAQSKCRNDRAIKRYLVKMSHIVERMFSEIPNDEKPKCANILTMFVERNKSHVDYMYGCSFGREPYKQEKKKILSPDILELKRTLESFDTLKNEQYSKELIDELAYLFESCKLESDITEDNLFDIASIDFQLLCKLKGSPELVSYMLSMEQFKKGKSHLLKGPTFEFINESDQ
ncbi:hypothetical protein HK100_008771 [Physocladia obscura]|uniref:BZIP domain-containing protein n=1 Tax=Physocladia obscura TaxID=109957 RepID=A0AAD5XIA3_9FUNG|nr:hypothetical protein HK100_008771 [Physocladia obscura]